MIFILALGQLVTATSLFINVNYNILRYMT